MTALILVVGIVAVPVILAGYIALVEIVLRALPEKRQPTLRPWLWMAPALLFLAVFLLYPTLNTLYLSLLDAQSTVFVGFRNYVRAVTNYEVQIAFRNNLLWLTVFSTISVGLGLVLAIVTDRLWYQSAVKSIMFIPMAISFVAAGVIWKFVYEFRPLGEAQIGSLNAVLGVVARDFRPVAWLVAPFTNNLALIAVGVWIWTGFCLVILSAALRAIPAELMDAARVDGAGEWQVASRIVVPALGPTISVVATTLAIFALKAFDIVYVMTSGNFGTEVIANRMYREMFTFQDFGRASALAVILLAATVPVAVANVRQFRRQEALR
jgi:alpha-glucoside transport system permease protein